ncbi:MAG TPA: 2Fe-2S iron-sulfur cluster-binding protein, partial [Solirubrobacteraceae bacterium]
MAGEGGAVHSIEVTVNGETHQVAVEARRLLVHFIRETLGMRGTHIGCDSGNCGACSVICDGQLIKSCMMLAVQADGREIETIESLGEGP